MKALLLCLVLCVVCGCDAPKQVSAEKFQQEYAAVGMAQTMHYVEYLGQHDGRAYIRRQSMSPLTRKWSDHVVYVELADLDPAFRATLPAKELKAP